MPEEVFLSEQHPVSRRWAVLEDDCLSAWLYLTAPDSEKPVADCWIYNHISSTESAESHMTHGVAPPASPEVIGDGAVMQPGGPSEFRLEWSRNGESIALFFGEALMGFIVSEQRRGYSRNLRESCAWGNPLDKTLYRSVFSTA
jgi:hypothetical protein